MKPSQKKIAVLIGSAAALGALALVVSRVSPPAQEKVQGLIGRGPRFDKLCVTAIRDKTEKKVAPQGMEEVLVGRLKQVGFDAAAVPAGQDRAASCDAFVYTELVSLSGRKAEVDFRLVINGEQAPALSSTVTGKAEKLPPITAVSNGAVAAAAFTSSGPEAMDAISAAFARQAQMLREARLR